MLCMRGILLNDKNIFILAGNLDFQLFTGYT